MNCKNINGHSLMKIFIMLKKSIADLLLSSAGKKIEDGVVALKKES